MNVNAGRIMHPREKLPHPAVSVLHTSPEVNFQCGRCFVTRQRFESRVEFITIHFWKIQIFSTFVKNNIDIIINKGFICGDLKVFSQFLEKAFSISVCENPKSIFKKICCNFPFEFLIMFDLFREYAP